MTYFMHDDYNIYDSLPCSAVIFARNENFDVIYSNTVYKELFGSEQIKILKDDLDEFNKVLDMADEPQSTCIRCEKSQGELIDVRAFVVKMSEDKIFAILIDDNENAEEIRELHKECAGYATALRGTDEIFYDYIKETDTVTIYYPTKEGKMESKQIVGFFKNMAANKFILEDDIATIASLEDNVKVERRFEVRMRLREKEDFSWYAVVAKPDEQNAGLFVGTARNIQTQKDEESRLKEKVLIDPLSKVYTRSAAIEEIEKQLAIRSDDCECALIVMDIDNFKRINDTFGHLYGDAVIAMSAGSIKSTLDENDIVGRFGGDEFFAFIDNAETEFLEKKLEAIRLSILKMRLDENDDKDISCSIGVTIGNGTSTYEELFRQADSALYKAKENGKNRFEYFDGTYTEAGAISYTKRHNDDESTEAHNITAVALEIASKSTNSESAILNILRHVGMTLDLDCIQVMEYDMIEDRVYLTYQWHRVVGEEYNVVFTERKSGYYNHNDLVLFRNRFAKDKIFQYTPDFKEGFSQKYRDLFEHLESIISVYASNTESENWFSGITFQSWSQDRVFKDSEFNDMFEITKIISMHMKNSQQISEREKMLIQRIDYRNGLYSLSKFYEESSRIGRDARAADEILGVLNIDIKDLYGINVTYGCVMGDKILAKITDALRAADNSRVISCSIEGTDMFVTLFRLKDKEKAHMEIIRFLESVAAQFPEMQEPPVILKGGLCFFNPGQRVGDYIDASKAVKKGRNFDRCDCIIMENVLSQLNPQNNKK